MDVKSLMRTHFYHILTQHLNPVIGAPGNWLQGVPAQKFYFNSDKLMQYKAHLGIPFFKPYQTPSFSDYMLFMTHRPVPEGITISRSISYINSNNDCYLGLVDDANITLAEFNSLEPATLLACIPFIMGLVDESYLIGSIAYTFSKEPLSQPLEHYLDPSLIPLFLEYSIFAQDFISDLEAMNYSTDEIQDIYRMVKESLSLVSYKYKGESLSVERSLHAICMEINTIVDEKQINLY